MTNEMMEMLTKEGFKRWTKNTMDRMYVNANVLGLNAETATFKGRKISNTYTRELQSAKTYIDLVKNEIHSDKWELAAGVAEIMGVEYDGTPNTIKF